MLYKRILSALVLIPIVLSLVMKSSTIVFAIVSLLFLLLALNEWAGLFNFSLPNNLCLLSSYLFLALFLLINTDYIDYFLYAVISLWLFYFCLVLLYNLNPSYTWIEVFKSNKTVSYISGLIFITGFWISLVGIKTCYQDGLILIAMLFMVWSIDTGAYFIGKYAGKTKLITNVSPNKTWEGIFGGLLFLCIINLVIYFCFNASLLGDNTISWFLTSIAIFIFAVFGDLVESMIKRILNIKDSGSLIPGHGGVLDRIDSLMAVAPLYYIIVK